MQRCFVLTKNQFVGLCCIQQAFQLGVFGSVEKAGRFAAQYDFMRKLNRGPFKITDRSLIWDIILKLFDFGVMRDGGDRLSAINGNVL